MVISGKSQKQKRMFCLSKINVCVSNLQRIFSYLQQFGVERKDEIANLCGYEVVRSG